MLRTTRVLFVMCFQFLHSVTPALEMATCSCQWEDGLSTPSPFLLLCCQLLVCRVTKLLASLSLDFAETYSLGLGGTSENSLYFCHATNFNCFQIHVLIS